MKFLSLAAIFLLILGCSDLGQEAPDVPTIDVPSSISFGNVSLGSSLDTSLSISNSGTANLTINSVVLAGDDAGDFTVLTDLEGEAIAPDSSKDMFLRFEPSSEDPKSATLEISSNDPEEGKVTVTLLGFGEYLVTYVSDVEAIIGPMGSAGCLGSCHGNRGWTFDAIVNVASSTGMNYITPGDTLNSYLYLKIIGAEGITGDRMPRDNPTFFDNHLDERLLISQWILQGAVEE